MRNRRPTPAGILAGAGRPNIFEGTVLRWRHGKNPRSIADLPQLTPRFEFRSLFAMKNQQNCASDGPRCPGNSRRGRRSEFLRRFCSQLFTVLYTEKTRIVQRLVRSSLFDLAVRAFDTFIQIYFSEDRKVGSAAAKRTNVLRSSAS